MMQWVMQANRLHLHGDSVIVHDANDLQCISGHARARLGSIQLSPVERMAQFFSEICDLSPPEHWDDGAMHSAVLASANARIVPRGHMVYYSPGCIFEVDGCVWLTTILQAHPTGPSARIAYVLVGVFDTNSAGAVVELRTCVDPQVCKSLCEQAQRCARCRLDPGSRTAPPPCFVEESSHL